MNLIRFLLTHLETKRTQKNIIFKNKSFHRCTTVQINSVNISSLVLLDFTSNWTFFQQCMHWAITPSVFAEVTAIDNHIRRNAHMKSPLKVLKYLTHVHSSFPLFINSYTSLYHAERNFNIKLLTIDDKAYVNEG